MDPWEPELTVPQIAARTLKVAKDLEALEPLLKPVIDAYAGGEFPGHIELSQKLRRYCHEAIHEPADRIRESTENLILVDKFMLFRAKTQDLAFSSVETILEPDAMKTDPVAVLMELGHDSQAAEQTTARVRADWEELFPHNSLYDVLEKLFKIIKDLKLD